MAKNILVISSDIRETRVALIEDGIIAELHLERSGNQPKGGSVGDVYLGRVTRVLPGLQAAFIDIGLERAAFLHVEDLIRPDDFEAYLAGGRKHALVEGPAESVEDDDIPEIPDELDAVADEVMVSPQEAPELPSPASAPEGIEDPDDDPVTSPPPAVADTFGLEDLDDPDLPGFTLTDPNEAPPKVRQDDRRGRRRRPGWREREGAREPRREGKPVVAAPRPNPPKAREPEPRSQVPARISKSTPIREVVREGQEILVQVTKEPIGTKGARCSSHVSLAGRYVVYLPTVEHIGVSKRIGSEKERGRLREAIESMKPPTGGLIVRTVAEGLTKKGLKQDVGYLVRLWGEIAKKREGGKAPVLLSSELDLVLKTARDLFTDEVEQIVIDDKKQYDRLVSFVEMFMPERLKDVILYGEDEPIFDAYGIEDEVARALARKVPLPSGGHLILDQAEALTAIDVNTGRFVGKGSKDMEETILKTNLEAVQEIAYQLRFRNIGGLIILDLIDMEKATNREKVRKKLEELLQKDKAKTTLNRISDLGLIEMTRKRTRESLGRLMHEPCFYCDGTGQLQSKETIAYEILREIRRKKRDLPGYSVVVNCHPAVADLFAGPEKAT
ncbi:MAG: Rne/Rng family ribonuclease, partial [Myxococcales bacterium]